MNKWIEIININLLAAATVISGPVHQYTVTVQNVTGKKYSKSNNCL